MSKFNLNGVNYKVVNDLVHEIHKGNLEPCYYKDGRTVLEEYCRTRGIKLYQRPDGIHTHGHQKGEARKPQAMTKKWMPVNAENHNDMLKECASYHIQSQHDPFAIPSYHAFLVNYVPWTETKGSRVSIKSLRYGKKITITSNGEDHFDDAILYLTLAGYKILGQAESANNGMILFSDCFDPTFF